MEIFINKVNNVLLKIQQLKFVSKKRDFIFLLPKIICQYRKLELHNTLKNL